jgi:hypothetical protein
MLNRNLRYGAWVAVAALLFSSVAGGCCCRTRKGIVLRGDWSLELNRVQHLQSNVPTYSGDCCGGVPCAAPCGCADGCCQHGGGMSGGYEVLDASGYPGGSGGAGGHGGGAGGYRHGGDGEVPMPAPPLPTPAAQSRFHPVPTRPAFEPQNVTWENEPPLAAAQAPVPSVPPRSTRRSTSRVAAGRQPARLAAAPSPIRRTSAEFEVDAPEGFDEPAALEPQAVEAPALLPAPSREPQPTTSTWRVKSHQS